MARKRSRELQFFWLGRRALSSPARRECLVWLRAASEEAHADEGAQHQDPAAADQSEVEPRERQVAGIDRRTGCCPVPPAVGIAVAAAGLGLDDCNFVAVAAAGLRHGRCR